MRFLAIEHELPSNQVTNDEVVANVRQASARNLSARELDVVEEMMWELFKSTGTRVRYHRSDAEHAVDLAVRAGRRALDSAGLDPLDIDLLIYVGIGRGIVEPASANIYQDLLGLRDATAFDVLDACASWVRALELAHLFLANGRYRNVMIMNAEFAGREVHRYELGSVEEFAHWHPSVTIGEAATATIVTGSGPDHQFATDFRTWGEKRDLCFVPLPNFDGYFGKPVNLAGEVVPLQFVSFGLRLMEFGTRKLVEHYRTRPQFKEFGPDIVFGHAASDGMSEYVTKACGIDRTKFQFGHARHANTVSASVPLAMSEALKAGMLKDGDRVLVLVASAGVTTALTKFVFRN
ncbi:MAG TPA: 3-oxoacyl-[acyl-carrier-protein] synthase III C-terminal domain-containing protein [Amycolatopsis sp.]|uniref:3-oxoacyl-ACP synthase III family protein n=1 Tax=Amycolatopsis sp. TaxID=37632 RepID=UPI002B49A380|nr:3-oxoacyl-[acyl-carrier-protein] synthase III C-terminal domain-containing protein [Amycolatopsis sp.]HKS46935.1 3-oxoacyl-[acyl-carrier-protein] synthase III C-terminal domain-containing protein [Amycolatopsis sp.]